LRINHAALTQLEFKGRESNLDGEYNSIWDSDEVPRLPRISVQSLMAL
jgi:hypothetical protein